MASKNKKIFLEDKYCSLAPDCMIKLSENKVEYLLKNNYSLPVFKTHVDGGMYSDETGKRCDYALSSKEYGTIILIELKGTDIDKAVEQISSTLSDFESKYRYERYYGRIVASKVPSIALHSNKYKRLSGRIKAYKGSLISSSKKMMESLDCDFSLI